jgi:hypothetical protein
MCSAVRFAVDHGPRTNKLENKNDNMKARVYTRQLLQLAKEVSEINVMNSTGGQFVRQAMQYRVRLGASRQL